MIRSIILQYFRVNAHINRYTYTGWAKKTKPHTFVTPSPNIDRFSKFFHQNILEKICNKLVINYTTTP